MSSFNNIPGIGDVLALLPEYEPCIKKCLSDPVEIYDELEKHAAAEAGKILLSSRPIKNGNTTTGILVNELRLFRLAMFLGGGDAAANGPNVRNVYYAAYIPEVSLIDQFFSFPFGKNDLLRITRIRNFDVSELVTYIDINFYLRKANTASIFLNGSIDETVTSYQYNSVNLPNTITLSCVSDINVGDVSRKIPIEWTKEYGGTICILFRVSKNNSGKSINPNRYFKIEYSQDYFRSNSFYSLATAPANSPFKTPLKHIYPIDSVARSTFSNYVALYTAPTYTSVPIFPYFGNLNVVFPGQAVDCAFKAQENQCDILFDTRACTYFSSAYFDVEPYDQIIVVSFNHKLEEGRCRYASVTIYDGTDNTIMASNLVIPESSIPSNPYLLTIYVNNQPDKVKVIVAERIYQYPAPEYANCQNMSVFVKRYSP